VRAQPAIRVLLLLASLAAIGWSIAAMRATDAFNDAVRITGLIQFGAAQPGDRERARDAIERSRQFGPDTRAMRAEAFLLLATGQPRRAAARAQDVIRREPESLDAWGILYEAARQFDQARAREALRRAQELNPLAGRRPS
jgi:hypothetical protein